MSPGRLIGWCIAPFVNGLHGLMMVAVVWVIFSLYDSNGMIMLMLVSGGGDSGDGDSCIGGVVVVVALQ